MSARRTKIEKREEQSRISRLLMKVEVYLNYKLWKQATSAVDELLELEPGHVEGHKRRLEILERSGDREGAVRQLVVLASHTVSDPPVANGFLMRALQRAEKKEIRKLADELGLALNAVLRVQTDEDVDIDTPDTWPFGADELSTRWCCIRRLTDPAELRVINHSEGDVEAFAALASHIAEIALKAPIARDSTWVLFIDDRISYGVFTDPHFVGVHEYPTNLLGRVASRLQRMSREEDP